MGFKNLIEWTDGILKGELSNYYIVTKDRLNNLISNFESQCEHIDKLTKIIALQQEQIAKLQKDIIQGEGK